MVRLTIHEIAPKLFLPEPIVDRLHPVPHQASHNVHVVNGVQNECLQLKLQDPRG